MATVNLQIPSKLLPFFDHYRYKVAWGGRGGAKSWSVAQVLVAQAHTGQERILCTRQFQSSIEESVYKVIRDVIEAIGLSDYFDIQERKIFSKVTGSEFIFKGLYANINEIKSMEGVTKTWVEEAQIVSQDRWDLLLPTIFRRPNCELFVTYNPKNFDDPVHQMFVAHPPPQNSVVVKINWQDNPWFPPELNELRLQQLERDPKRYAHVWEGECLEETDAKVMLDKCVFESQFDYPPLGTEMYPGLDFGFSVDPTALVRTFISGDNLMVSDELYYPEYPLVAESSRTHLFAPWKDNTGVDIDYLPEFIRMMPLAERQQILADSSRPETISYLKRQGFRIDAADKWPGSVEDGISHLRGFRRIYIHKRCPNFMIEAKNYSFKTDPKNPAKVLSTLAPGYDHGWDAARYGMGKFIQARGNLGVWRKLAGKA